MPPRVLPTLVVLSPAVSSPDSSLSGSAAEPAHKRGALGKERKKENTQPKGGMGERHAATTQGF